MSGITGGHLFTGKATITFAGGAISHADNCEIVFNPTVLVKADVLASAGALDAACPVKGIAVNVQDAEVSLDSFSAASGFNGNTAAVGSANVLYFDTSIVTLPAGAAAVAWTRDDGRVQRVYLKRAKKLPQAQSVKLGNQQFAEFTYQLLMVDPGDNTNIAGQFEDGDIG